MKSLEIYQSNNGSFPLIAAEMFVRAGHMIGVAPRTLRTASMYANYQKMVAGTELPSLNIKEQLLSSETRFLKPIGEYDLIINILARCGYVLLHSVYWLNPEQPKEMCEVADMACNQYGFKGVLVWETCENMRSIPDMRHFHVIGELNPGKISV